MDDVEPHDVVWADPSPLEGWWERMMFGVVTTPAAGGSATTTRAAVDAVPRRPRRLA